MLKSTWFRQMVERDDALRLYVRKALSGYSKLLWGRATRIIAEVRDGNVVYSRRDVLEEVTKCVLLLQAEACGTDIMAMESTVEQEMMNLVWRCNNDYGALEPDLLSPMILQVWILEIWGFWSLGYTFRVEP